MQITTETEESMQAIVLQACIAGRAMRLTYELSWWNGYSFNSEWFDSGLVQQCKEETEQIGFRCS